VGAATVALLTALTGDAWAQERAAVQEPPAAPDAAPRATLLYQNFPNPFPTAESATTCVWFDLRDAADVRLDVYDLRGNHVRSLVPAAEVGGVLPAGRYGRATPGGSSGCDPRFAWDGRASDGRTVPTGVYLLRMRAGAVDMTRKMLYRGR
jgi:hypothetical protein